MNHDSRQGGGTPTFWRSRFGIAWLALVLVASWYLWTSHRVHVLAVVPYLFLLACPLMHFFMHRGHHHGSTGGQTGDAGAAGSPGQTGDPGAPAGRQ